MGADEANRCKAPDHYSRETGLHVVEIRAHTDAADAGIGDILFEGLTETHAPSRLARQAGGPYDPHVR